MTGRPTMKIENETDYDGRALRSIVCGVHRWLAKTEGRLRQWSRVRIRIYYTRTRSTGGHAYLRGGFAQIGVPRPDASYRDGRWVGKEYVWSGTARGAKVENFVGTVWHELLHLYGYRHDSMARYEPDATEMAEICASLDLDPDEGIPLRPSLRPKEPREPVEVPDARAAGLGALLGALEARESDLRDEADRYETALREALVKRKEWTTKARRAKTYLSKYRSRENRARRKLRDLGLDPDAIAADELGDYEPAMAGDLKV